MARGDVRIVTSRTARLTKDLMLWRPRSVPDAADEQLGDRSGCSPGFARVRFARGHQGNTSGPVKSSNVRRYSLSANRLDSPSCGCFLIVTTRWLPLFLYCPRKTSTPW